MKTAVLKVISLMGAVIMTLFFYKKGIGLNLFFIELAFILFSHFTKRIDLNSRLSLFSTICLLLSAIFLVVTHSDLAFVMNLVTLVLFVGVNLFPNAKALTTSFSLGIASFFNSQKKLFEQSTSSSKSQLANWLWRSRLYLMPVFLILIFTLFYRNSNPIFNDLMSYLEDLVPSSEWLEMLNFNLLLTFLFCLIFANFLFLPVKNTSIIQSDKDSSEVLVRKRTRSLMKLKMNSLTNQLNSAIFLFFGLNLILLILNCMDIYFVWFNFSWKQNTLKAFVHEGTFYLLFSIILSVGLVLYYFKGNLNFYFKNTLLKKLCAFWLAQNIILTISVGVRTYWYINYFSLAHLRIGLIIFLILTIVGLFTVIIKVRQAKSIFYLVRINGLAIYSVMLVASFVDWDLVIARYNVSQKSKSYYHLDFMSSLSYKTLPIVDLSTEELNETQKLRSDRYSFEMNIMKSAEYTERINERKNEFIEKWEEIHFLEWNLADQWAYEELLKFKEDE
ncbi:MAG: DUF4173 domain-containing protein [Flavobacteriales bacterium]